MRSLSKPNTKNKGKPLKLPSLYKIAERNNIIIDETCPENLISLSVCFPDNSMLIALSKLSQAPKGTTKTECFAHELGHCMTGSFYLGYSPFELRIKHEHTANKWAIQKLIPFSSLIAAAKEGCHERYQFAEYFDVSETFIQKAIDYHASHGKVLPRGDIEI